jgi:hypothetical protein
MVTNCNRLFLDSSKVISKSFIAFDQYWFGFLYGGGPFCVLLIIPFLLQLFADVVDKLAKKWKPEGIHDTSYEDIKMGIIGRSGIFDRNPLLRRLRKHHHVYSRKSR